MSFTGTTVYQFDDFRLDAKNLTLTHRRQNVPLPPKTVATLLALVQKSGQIVTKNELIREVWQARYVSESGLYHHISALRTMLRQRGGAAGAYIETLPRRGYRFTGEVSLAPHQEPASSVRKAIAVLPLKVTGSEKNPDYLGLGIADEIVTRLSNLKEYAVRPISSVYKYLNAGYDELTVGTDMQVQLILSGNLLIYGEDCKVTIQCFDVARQEILWGASFPGRTSKFLDLQSLVVAGVENQLTHKSFTVNNSASATADEKAHREYLRGRFCFSLRTRESLLQAIDHFKKAVEYDNGFAQAHAELALTFAACNGLDLFSYEKIWGETIRYATHALELDPANHTAHAVLALAKFRYEWQWAESERGFLTALQLNPKDDLAHRWYGLFLTSMQRFDEAEREFETALRLNPTSQIHRTGKIRMLYLRREYEQTVAECVEEMKINQDLKLMHEVFANSLARLGRFDEAAKILTDEYACRPTSSLLGTLGVVKAIANERAAAESIINQLTELSTRQEVREYEFAIIHASLGNSDKAFHYLDRAFIKREGYLTQIQIDHDLDPLRTDRRFRKFLSRMTLV